jgi:sulfate adenylyltransferase
MIKPHGSDNLCPLFVDDKAQNSALLNEAETLPKLLLDSAAAANAVMLGAGYFTPLKGYMNLQDTLNIAETMQTSDGLFWPVPCLNRATEIDAIKDAKRIALQDPNIDGNPVIAIQDIESIEELTDEQLQGITEKIFPGLFELPCR